MLCLPLTRSEFSSLIILFFLIIFVFNKEWCGNQDLLQFKMIPLEDFMIKEIRNRSILFVLKEQYYLFLTQEAQSQSEYTNFAYHTCSSSQPHTYSNSYHPTCFPLLIMHGPFINCHKSLMK